MERRNAIVEVVVVGKRTRVRPVGDTRFVQFPRSLRLAGARYQVEVLRPNAGGKSWRASGELRRVG